MVLGGAEVVVVTCEAVDAVATVVVSAGTGAMSRTSRLWHKLDQPSNISIMYKGGLCPALENHCMVS